jgi:hypothetical protein
MISGLTKSLQPTAFGGGCAPPLARGSEGPHRPSRRPSSRGIARGFGSFGAALEPLEEHCSSKG